MHDHRRDALGLVQSNLAHPRRLQGRLDELDGVVAVRHHVDALTAQLVRDVANTTTARADAGADGVDHVIVRRHRDLAAVTGFARQGLDLHDAVGDLGHFDFEELGHQRRVGAAHHDLGTLVGLAHFDDVDLDARAVLVAFESDLLGLGQQRFHPTEVEQRVAVVVLLHRARDDVAFAIRELFVHLTSLDVSNELHQDLLGGLGRDASEVLGRGVPLARDVALDVEFQSPDLDLAGLGIDLHFGVFGRVGTALVGGEERVGEGDEQLPFVDVLVTCNLSQRF